MGAWFNGSIRVNRLPLRVVSASKNMAWSCYCVASPLCYVPGPSFTSMKFRSAEVTVQTGFAGCQLRLQFNGHLTPS